MRRVRGFPALMLIPIAALIVAAPLLLGGCSCGHDFDFHLVSWFEAAAQFRAGGGHPQWAFSPAWNAGEPRFVFYPPLSWTVGAVLGMVLPWSWVPQIYTWLALVAAGLGMYRLGRVFAGEWAAALAAMVYVANPYMVFTAYERTAYAELLAAAWIPLLLAGVLRRRVTVLGVAVPVALLWLTNAPAAVMGCYALGVVWVVRGVVLAREQGGGAVEDGGAVRFAAKTVAGVALGLGLAAFYVVPAAYERRWVEIAMAMVEGMRIGDNFLFHHTADALHDEVLRTASWIALGMLGATAGVLGWTVWAGDRARRGTAGLVSLGILTGGIGILLTPVSAAVWRVAPEMAFLQFPWRLVAVLAAVLGAGIAMALAQMEGRRGHLRSGWVGVGGMVLVAAMSWPAAHGFWQACDEEDTVAARLAVFQAKAGTDATDEYTPKDADNDVLGHANPPYWLGTNADAAAPAGARAGQAERRFTAASREAQMLVLNLRAYPAWRVRVNGAEVPARSERADGLIAVTVPKGAVRVEIAWVRTRDAAVGWWISGVSGTLALGMMGMGWRRRYGARLPEGRRSVMIES
jgi:hypothetical protein